MASRLSFFAVTNHSHKFGAAHQHNFVQRGGMYGAACMTMCVNLDYQTGRPDIVECAKRGSSQDSWRSLPVSGNNFLDGFMGWMGRVSGARESALPLKQQRADIDSAGKIKVTHADDGFRLIAQWRNENETIRDGNRIKTGV